MSLIILDRDGVINQDSDNYVKSVDEWLPIPGSIEAIARLCSHGYTVAVATNQSGIAREYFTLDDLEAMHEKLVSLVEAAGGTIAGIFYCPHGPDDGCDCRKPKPGLIEAIERELSVSAAGCPIVGDSLRDLQAGVAVGCRPMLVKTGNGTATAEKTLPERTEIFDDLAAVADARITETAGS